MKQIIFLFIIAISYQHCPAQQAEPCDCAITRANAEIRSHEKFRNYPCFSDFVKANMKIAKLADYIGKDEKHTSLQRTDCDDDRAVFSGKIDDDQFDMKISQGRFFMSEHKWTHDSIYLGKNELHLIRTGIDGKDFLGIQMGQQDVLEEQQLISKIDLTWGESVYSIPVAKHLYIFNPNFCEDHEFSKSISAYKIGDAKLALYIYGNVNARRHSEYIAKLIIDKNEGYQGAIFANDYELKAYGWMRCEEFRGF